MFNREQERNKQQQVDISAVTASVKQYLQAIQHTSCSTGGPLNPPLKLSDLLERIIIQ